MPRDVLDKHFSRRGPGRRRPGRRRADGRAGSALHFLQPGLEAVALEQCGEGLCILLLGRKVVQGRGQRNIALDREQMTALGQPFERLAQVLAHRAADFTGVRHHRVEAAVLRQPLHRRLGPDLVHAGHVVHGIADQRKIVNDQGRRHAELLCHAGFIEHFVAHGVDQGHAGIHQLGEVLVTGGHDGFHAFARRHVRQRADHVVCFHAVYHQQRPAEGAHGVVQRRYLRDQVIGHRRAVGLVVGVKVVAKGFTLGVKDAGEIIRLVVVSEPA